MLHGVVFSLYSLATEETHFVPSSPCHDFDNEVDASRIQVRHTGNELSWVTLHRTLHYNYVNRLLCLHKKTSLISEWETKCKSVLQHSATSYIQSSKICHFSVESGREKESESKSEC